MLHRPGRQWLPGCSVEESATLTAEAVDYAKKACNCSSQAKTVDRLDATANKEVAIAYLNYTIGSLTLERIRRLRSST